MKTLIKGFLKRAGIYYAKRQYMPCGIDWLWDIERIAQRKAVRTVFDVGANIGQTTEAVQARFGDAVVHAFEPVGETYLTLARNVGHLRQVTCHRLALCDQVGQGRVTVGQNSKLNRLLDGGDTDASSSSAPQAEIVETDTIDHFCAVHRVDRIDILKIDAEGADLRVLQGASRMLRLGKVAFVFVEVGFVKDDQTHVHLPLIDAFLSGSGLRAYSFYDYCRLQPPGYVEEGLGLVFANVLFVSRMGIESMQ